MKKRLSLFVIAIILITGLMLFGTVTVFADSGGPESGMENILAFIRPELFILIVFLYCAGLFLKKWDGFKNEWTIPYILLGLSVLITMAYVCIYLAEGFSPPVIVAVIIQSVLIAAVAVFGNELLKQVLVKRNE